jgi:hypothetical protein
MQKKTYCSLVLIFLLCCSYAASGDEARCDKERDELLASIAQDRKIEQTALEQQIAATNDQVEQEHLRGVIEQAWDEEERLRSIASHIWRDCIRAARVRQ